MRGDAVYTMGDRPCIDELAARSSVFRSKARNVSLVTIRPCGWCLASLFSSPPCFSDPLFISGSTNCNLCELRGIVFFVVCGDGGGGVVGVGVFFPQSSPRLTVAHSRVLTRGHPSTPLAVVTFFHSTLGRPVYLQRRSDSHTLLYLRFMGCGGCAF